MMQPSAMPASFPGMSMTSSSASAYSASAYSSSFHFQHFQRVILQQDAPNLFFHRNVISGVVVLFVQFGCIRQQYVFHQGWKHASLRLVVVYFILHTHKVCRRNHPARVGNVQLNRRQQHVGQQCIRSLDAGLRVHALQRVVQTKHGVRPNRHVRESNGLVHVRIRTTQYLRHFGPEKIFRVPREVYPFKHLVQPCGKPNCR